MTACREESEKMLEYCNMFTMLKLVLEAKMGLEDLLELSLLNKYRHIIQFPGTTDLLWGKKKKKRIPANNVS